MVVSCGALRPALLIAGGFFLLLGTDLYLLVLDIEAQAVVDAHILIGYPHQSEQRHEIAAPVRVEQFEAGDDKKQCGYVVTETVLAREEVEKFAAQRRLGVLRLIMAVVAGLAKNFFVGDGPGDAGHRNREYEQPGKLLA